MDKMEKLHEILDLVIEINGMEPRKRDITGEKPTVFLEYAGHTNG